MKCIIHGVEFEVEKVADCLNVAFLKGKATDGSRVITIQILKISGARSVSDLTPN